MIELTHRRKWNSKLFDTGRTQLDIDGITEHIIYGTKIQDGLHDIEPDGSFVEINTLFEQVNDSDETNKVRRTRCGRISISNKLDQSKDRIKILTKNGNGITLKLKGYKTYGPHFDNLKSCYYTTDEGYILRYYPHYKGVRLVIEIPNPQTSMNIFRFVCREIGCNYTYEETDNGIRCVSETGKDDIFIEASYVVDSNRDYGTISVKLGGLTPGGHQIIRKVIDPIWLGSAIGPVLADPNVTIDDSTGTLEDTYIDVFNPTFNFGAQTFIGFKDYAAGEKISTLVYVDLSGEPGGTVITSRFGFDIYLQSLTVNWQSFKVLTSWGEGNKTSSAAGAGESSWNTSESPTTWNTAGCKGSGTDRASSSDSTGSITTTSSDYQVTVAAATTQDWLDNAANNKGFLIEGQGGDASGSFAFARSSESGVGNIPYFYYEYVAGNYIPFFFDGGYY